MHKIIIWFSLTALLRSILEKGGEGEQQDYLCGGEDERIKIPSCTIIIAHNFREVKFSRIYRDPQNFNPTKFCISVATSEAMHENLTPRKSILTESTQI